MAIWTNRGKRLLKSFALRLSTHPLGEGMPAGNPPPPGGFINPMRAEWLGDAPAWWVHLIRQTYFAIGMNADDGTLGEIHARSANSVVGRNAHATPTPWWLGNAIRLGPNYIPPPNVEDDGDDSCTYPFPPITITTQTGPDYAGFTGDNRIGGFALCLSNSAVDDNEVLGIFEFNTVIAPASAGQTILIQNQGLILAES